MRTRDAALAVEAGHERDAELFGEGDGFALGARAGHAAADHHYRSLGAREHRERSLDVMWLSGGTKRGILPEARLDQHGLADRRVRGVALLAGELEVDRPRRTRCCRPKGVTDHVWNALDRLDPPTELGHLR